MDYSSMIRQAWTITWRYRFLWLLGVLAGGAVGVPGLGGGGGGNTGWRLERSDLERMNASLPVTAQEIGNWMSANIGLLLGLALLGALIILLLIILSFIAQGGMAQATANLLNGQPSSLSTAWSAGMRLFWQYVGLWLILVAATIVIAACVGVIVAAAVAGFASNQPLIAASLAIVVYLGIVLGFVLAVLRVTRESDIPRWVVVLASALFALPIVTVLLVVALMLSIVVAFAQRAIALENIGPLAAMRSGWQLAQAHLGETLLTWLVNLGLALASGIVLVTVALAALVLLAGVGAVVVSVVGFSAPTVLYAAIAGILFLAAVLTAAGIANTFFWTFWTLVYLRLRGGATHAV